MRRGRRVLWEKNCCEKFNKSDFDDSIISRMDELYGRVTLAVSKKPIDFCDSTTLDFNGDALDFIEVLVRRCDELDVPISIISSVFNDEAEFGRFVNKPFKDLLKWVIVLYPSLDEVERDEFLRSGGALNVRDIVCIPPGLDRHEALAKIFMHLENNAA